MFPIKRALLVINRVAGVGNASLAEHLDSVFTESLHGRVETKVTLVDDHLSARNCTTQFMQSSDEPSIVIAGGGGGTLRAVIEGICGENGSGALPAAERARVGALRMGSGNVLAKRFGVPLDPIDGLKGLLKNLEAGHTVPCCVLRCEVWKSDGQSEIHHAATMAGFGQFGRIPSDLARWQRRAAWLHKSAARLVGIERLTNFEYATTLCLRSLAAVRSMKSTEAVEIRFNAARQSMRLLSALALSFPIAHLPFNPIQNGRVSFSVFLIPRSGRFTPLLQMFPRRLSKQAQRIDLQNNQRLEVHLTDRDRVSFFLDEDTITTYRRFRLQVAGSLAFVPGPNYAIKKRCA